VADLRTARTRSGPTADDGPMNDAIVTPLGFSHVRLTVTDIRRSKAFYEQLFGMPPGSDFSGGRV